MKTRREAAALRAAAEQHAMYARELQTAHYRIEQREMWSYVGRFLYGLAALLASGALWGAVLPLDMPGVLRVVAWILLIGTWIGLLWLRHMAVRKLRLAIQQRRTERMSM